jgi:flagellar biosynthesis/type III secretory pathway ATPase
MITPEIVKNKFESVIKNTNTLQYSGRITKVIGLVLESEGPKAPIGEVCVFEKIALIKKSVGPKL